MSTYDEDDDPTGGSAPPMPRSPAWDAPQDRFHAWRHNSTDSRPLYVEWIGNGQQRGDRYSYTTDVAKAKPLTAHQCRAFCSYMTKCGTVGFWSQHPLEKKP